MTLPMPPLYRSAERALHTLCSFSGTGSLAELSGAGLLMERARLLGLRFGVRRSPGGFCRLLDADGGPIAVNLPRDSDWELVPAWLEETPELVRTWRGLADAVRHRSVVELQERARLMGLAAAAAVEPASEPPPFHRIEGPPLPFPADATPAGRRPPRVVDLSSLWAGPLCSQLLHLCGAEVIKVESSQRPDGAREGNETFYGLLNQGKRCAAFDFRDARARQSLFRLIESADIVIEASRPRALHQLGIDVRRVLAQHSALTWVSITGYGRDEPQANWIAFGDDAGVAAGLSQVMRTATGDVQILGDAIADPLTGIRAALAAWQSWQSGRGRLITLALADVAAASLAEERSDLGREGLHRAFADWWAAVRGLRLDPGTDVRVVTEAVHALGEDTHSVLAELPERC